MWLKPGSNALLLLLVFWALLLAPAGSQEQDTKASDLPLSLSGSSQGIESSLPPPEQTLIERTEKLEALLRMQANDLEAWLLDWETWNEQVQTELSALRRDCEQLYKDSETWQSKLDALQKAYENKLADSAREREQERAKMILNQQHQTIELWVWRATTALGIIGIFVALFK